ncbi:hypothetical protein [Crassaminicella indica]|uniref:Uncharacterized protein n=1 Tax=Crassaminicella indica TaxID=2855394 RepID=A0ABX8RAD7_9CLOT|nr:hypothetical protein [Crassaminicella indica]QXM05424.1 hypothetical protein KVH43_08495 [Crassaminicella indica]
MLVEKALMKEEVKLILPNYKEIGEQIEKLRDSLLGMPLGNKKRSDEYYRNNFSILGGRGTGKTSVLLSLMNCLRAKKNINNDFVMPLIVPDKISEASDVLGWIIDSFEDEVNNCVKKYCEKLKGRNFEHSEYFKYCIKEEKTELERLFIKLQEDYVYRKIRYYEVIKENYVGKNEYRKDNLRILNADIELGKTFNKFIDELIFFKKNKLKEDENGKEPLIFIFFDDVDICHERCIEILLTILRYLTHPNIVTITSGDYKIFHEELTMEFLRKDQVFRESLMTKIYSDKEDSYSENKQTALEIRKELSHNYLKKILPPVFRYEIKELSNEDKKDFGYIENNKKDQNKEDNKGHLLKKLKKITNIDEKELEIYLRIFDNTPRGLANVYQFVCDNGEFDIKKRKQLLHIIVDTNNQLKKYKKYIYKMIHLDKKISSDESPRINYELLGLYFYKLYSECNEIEKRRELFDDFVVLFSLLNFFEKIDINLDKRINEQESGKVLIEILKSRNEALYPNVYDIKEDKNKESATDDKKNNGCIKHMKDISNMLKLYDWASEDIFRNKAERFYFEGKIYGKYISKFAKKYFEQINSSFNTDENLDIGGIFKKIYESDPRWVRNKVNFIYENSKTIDEIWKDKCIETIDIMFKLTGKKKSDILKEVNKEAGTDYNKKLIIRKIEAKENLGKGDPEKIKRVFDKLLEWYDDSNEIEFEEYFAELKKLYEEYLIYINCDKENNLERKIDELKTIIKEKGENRLEKIIEEINNNLEETIDYTLSGIAETFDKESLNSWQQVYEVYRDIFLECRKYITPKEKGNKNDEEYYADEEVVLKSDIEEILLKIRSFDILGVNGIVDELLKEFYYINKKVLKNKIKEMKHKIETIGLEKRIKKQIQKYLEIVENSPVEILKGDNRKVGKLRRKLCQEDLKKVFYEYVQASTMIEYLSRKNINDEFSEFRKQIEANQDGKGLGRYLKERVNKRALYKEFNEKFKKEFIKSIG